jgi:UDP-N-acetylglucosamine--N-acetylmuramyl-(pentapeptide) pyrophosphoryl-undecaprenol N-acetylglucosamine transferase
VGSEMCIRDRKQGSHKINSFVEKNLILFLSSYNVIHQCGNSSVYGDDDNLLKLRENLSPELRERYLVKDFFSAEEIGSVFARADIVISRAGANAVYEIGALGKVALLIPIPWSSRNEQELNAQFLSSGGGAALLEERDLTEKKFFSLLEDLSSNYEFYRNKAAEFSKKFPLNGAEAIAELVMALINSGD